MNRLLGEPGAVAAADSSDVKFFGNMKPLLHIDYRFAVFLRHNLKVSMNVFTIVYPKIEV